MDKPTSFVLGAPASLMGPEVGAPALRRKWGSGRLALPLPALLLVSFLIGAGEIDYDVLLLLTGFSVILSTSAEASSCFRQATKQTAGASEALEFR
jgi:hypothetical protein